MKSLTGDRDLMLRVCRLYYVENRTQNEISHIAGISRPQVSRILSKARQEGIVKVKIDPGVVGNAKGVSSELKKKFGLKNVVVTDEESNEDVIRSLAISAARFLSEHIKDGQLIGISWGRTLHATVDRIVFDGEYRNTSFVPLIGGVGQFRHEYQMNSIVEKIANAFKSNRYYLYAPAHLKNSKTLKMMLEDDSINLVVEMWKKLDLAIVGIGEPISLANAFRNIYGQAFLSTLMKQAAAGDIAARFFTADGTPCSSANENILGISLEQLKTIPEVIGIAGGKEKVSAIHAVVKAGYINSLITDKKTALQIVSMDG